MAICHQNMLMLLQKRFIYTHIDEHLAQRGVTRTHAAQDAPLRVLSKYRYAEIYLQKYFVLSSTNLDLHTIISEFLFYLFTSHNQS